MKMDFKREIVLTWLSIFVFLVIMQTILYFLRGGWFYGTDAYYLATFVQENTVPNGYTPLFYALIGALPWSDLIPWIVPCLFASIFAVEAGVITKLYLNGECEGKGQGSSDKQGDWCTRFRNIVINHPVFFGSWFCFGIPVFIFRGLFFEEDFLGLIFVFAAIIFAYMYILSNRLGRNDNTYFKLHLIMAILAFATWWRGVALFFPLFALFSFKDKMFRLWFIPVFGILCTLVLLPTLIPIPNFNVAENLPGFLFFPSSFLIGLVGVSELRHSPWFWKVVTIYTLLLSLYMYKFAVLAIIPVAVLCYVFAVRLDDFHTKKIWKYKLDLRPVVFFVQVFMISSLVAGFGGLYSIVPDSQLMEDLSEVVEITGNESIANEWRFGHWIKYLGGNPEFSPLNNRDFIQESNSSWVLGACTQGYPVIKEYDSFCLMNRTA